MINSGRVMVNDRIVREPGSRAAWGKDSIKVDGTDIPVPSPRTYLMLNKPFGYLCSLSDPEGRPVVSDLLQAIPHRLYPVGRLDFDSLGLLFLTDDGEWAHRLAHPRYRVPKTYKITVNGTVTEPVMDLLRNGVELEDGYSGPTKAVLLKVAGGKSIIRMTITSGRKRIIRRMLEVAGYQVVHLIRTGFGVLELGDLKIKEYRHLETHEVEAMKKMVGLN